VGPVPTRFPEARFVLLSISFFAACDNSWGGPPGPRPTPPSARRDEERVQGDRANQGICPTRWRFHLGRYDGRMQLIEIDPELNRRALEEAAKLYPEFAEQALHVIARPLSKGFAWQMVWKGAPPPGQQAWEFQNAAIRAYKRLASIND
jgi:hypothetical protein